MQIQPRSYTSVGTISLQTARLNLGRVEWEPSRKRLLRTMQDSWIQLKCARRSLLCTATGQIMEEGTSIRSVWLTWGLDKIRSSVIWLSTRGAGRLWDSGFSALHMASEETWRIKSMGMLKMTICLDSNYGERNVYPTQIDFGLRPQMEASSEIHLRKWEWTEEQNQGWHLRSSWIALNQSFLLTYFWPNWMVNMLHELLFSNFFSIFFCYFCLTPTM